MIYTYTHTHTHTHTVSYKFIQRGFKSNSSVYLSLLCYAIKEDGSCNKTQTAVAQWHLA